MLIICVSCGRTRTLERKPRGRFKCSRCGSLALRVIRRVKWWMPTADCDGAPAYEARMATFAELAGYARERGYKPGWATIKFRAIYGEWPNGESKAEPVLPGGRLMHWINLQNARFATAKRRERKDELGRHSQP